MNREVQLILQKMLTLFPLHQEWKQTLLFPLHKIQLKTIINIPLFKDTIVPQTLLITATPYIPLLSSKKCHKMKDVIGGPIVLPPLHSSFFSPIRISYNHFLSQSTPILYHFMLRFDIHFLSFANFHSKAHIIIHVHTHIA